MTVFNKFGTENKYIHFWIFRYRQTTNSFEKSIIFQLKEASFFWYTGRRMNIFVILGQISNLFKVNQNNINFWKKNDA